MADEPAGPGSAGPGTTGPGSAGPGTAGPGIAEPDTAGPGIATLAEAAAKLGAAQRVLLSCHLGPDGDAAGSMCALAALLREQGRQATVYNPDSLPKTLRWLPHADTLVHKLPPGVKFDLTVVVDCGDRKLLGDRFPPPEVTGPVLALDHHASSRPFGDLFYADPSAASVGVLVARLANALGWPLSRDAGQGIYVSIVADTGSFRYANTNAEVFDIAGGLVKSGAVDPWHIAERLGEQNPLSRYRLLSAALAAMTIELGGKVALMIISDEMVKAAGATWDQTEGLVNYARALEGVECGVLLSPTKEKGGVRVSLRARGKIDAGAICLPFGGGGHPGAAGCRLSGTIPEAKTQILAAIKAALCPP